MTEIFPNYYKKFKCIADKCRHSCCVGWEIDIDEDTSRIYQSLEGSLGDRIRESIEGDPPHFILKAGDRCPFLAEDGLCDIIRDLGEDGLCDICHLHPRFRNYYDDFLETGLGLCCEEAARIILAENEKFSIDIPEEAKGGAFFRERQSVFEILQDRSRSILERLRMLADKYKLEFDFSGLELYDFYMSLERLDSSWDKRLLSLKGFEGFEIFEKDELQIAFEQLACYFVFRHFKLGVGFTLLSLWVLGAIFSSCGNREEIIDVSREYSCEIEYSEENTERVAEFLSNK